VSVLKIGINNIDNECNIINAFNFVLPEKDYPMYINVNNLNDLTTFIDFTDLNIDWIVMEYNEELFQDAILNNFNVLVILTDPDQMLAVIEYIHTIHDITGIDDQKIAVLDNEFTSNEVYESLKFIIEQRGIQNANI